MTLHHWNADLEPGHHATIYWDKHAPNELTAEVSRVGADGISDRVKAWHAANIPAGYRYLIARVRGWALENDCTVTNVSEGESAPK